MAHSENSEVTTTSDGPGGDASEPWQALARDYERARAKEDSLDRLVEWPAQRGVLGDVASRSVLDLGCGNGAKLAELVRDGAAASVGVDISGTFLTDPPSGMELVRGDLSDLDSVPALTGRTFDRIMFLQSIGYADDPVRTLRAARGMLTDDGFILLTRTHPIRYAVERAEQNGSTLGEEYYSTTPYEYVHSGWNDQITLTKRVYTIADLLNVFSAAGLWIEAAVEPRLSAEAGRRHPHKQAWMNKHLGILIFKLRPR
ncbi:class I SAM-dependent methyltransferase [Streptomyces sp. NPDC004031]